jgi:hypothetical protein
MDILQKISKLMSVSMPVSVFVVLVRDLVCVLACVCVSIKYGALKIYVRHGNYVADSKGSYKVA